MLGRCRWSEDGLPGTAEGKCGGDAADVIVADEEREGERLGDDLHALLVRVLLRSGRDIHSFGTAQYGTTQQSHATSDKITQTPYDK